MALDDAALHGVVGGWAVHAGGAGDDRLTGGATGEALIGFEGDDSISGGGGHDTVAAGGGDDWIYWSPGDGNDSIDGGAGHDRLQVNVETAGEMVVTLSDGTQLQPSYGPGGVWAFWPPPGSSGTLTVGGETLRFSNIDSIAARDMSRMFDDAM